jgi:hypothetical protein
VAFVSKQLGRDMTPIFDQYLRRSICRCSELTSQRRRRRTVSYQVECRGAWFHDRRFGR